MPVQVNRSQSDLINGPAGRRDILFIKVLSEQMHRYYRYNNSSNNKNRLKIIKLTLFICYPDLMDK